MEQIGIILQRLLCAVAIFCARIRAVLPHPQILHNARLARIDELENLLSTKLDETSLLLGRARFNQFLRVRPTEARPELGNVLIVAPTRGGKGLLAVSQLLTWQHAVIVNDIKGELFRQTAGYRSTLGKVFVIDPTGFGHRYDPLIGRQTEDQLLSSATQLLFKQNEGEGSIFTQRATVMLTQLFLAARAEGYAPLPYIRQIIRSGLADAATRLNSISPELATQFLDVNFAAVNFSDRFLLSAWSTLTSRMRALLTETVVRSLSAADFTAKELIHSRKGGAKQYPQKPITVYLRWPERDLLALSPLVRLLWGSLIDELITTYDQAEGKQCHPVLLLIDEAGRTAIPSLADHATTVVGRGISLWIAIQSLSQLDAVYGKTRAQILRDNMESQIYYRPSNQETADYLEHCLGRRSDMAHSQTMREAVETTQGLSEQGVPLMTAQEIKQLKDDDIIAFHRRLPPFKAKRIDWRSFPILERRQAIPPPNLSPLPQLEGRLRVAPEQRTEQFSNGYFDPDM